MKKVVRVRVNVGCVPVPGPVMPVVVPPIGSTDTTLLTLLPRTVLEPVTVWLVVPVMVGEGYE